MAIPVRHSNVFTMTAAGTISAGCGLVSNAEGTVVIGANDNDTNFVGFAIEPQVSGYAVAIAGPGSIVQAIGGDTISQGNYVMLHGASGRVGAIGIVSASSYNVVGVALEACDTAGDKVAIQVLNFRDHC